MSYGFKVVNDNGSIVVDDQHITLSVVAEGALNYEAGLFYNRHQGYYLYRDIQFGMTLRGVFPFVINSREAPLVVLIPTSPSGAIHSYQPLGSPGAWWGFEVAYRHSFYLPYEGRYGAIPPINWRYVVARMDMVPQSNEQWGIRVFNEQGRITFDSGVRIVRLKQHLRNWIETGGNWGWRTYYLPWEFPFDGEHGLLVSNLGIFEAYSSQTGGAYCSARFGFQGHGAIHAYVGGTTTLDRDRIGSYGGTQTDVVGRVMQAQTGGPQVFAVQLM
ncbi:hypothetical protein [Stutzerimonas stutzeri]|uniref:Uncharacterized protein n=1 Tax=Stutzerimonas stutzeri TaxID=316 RepID=A0AA42P879_STUST|nr:hypothetical protein [Stutzerimonas stutzeri]MDH1236566.1 hypothetical protein [Stutzerimonas stutzeri]